VVVTHDINWW